MLAQASAAAPNDVDLIYDQAMVAEKLNRLDEMERLLRRVIELKPDNQNAYNALGYSLADRKVRLEEARTLIQKAVQLAPDDPFIADSLGWVEYRLGNTTEAMRILEDAYKRRPDPEIGAHLGEVLWAAGQRDRAMSIWKGSVARGCGQRDAAGNAQAPARESCEPAWVAAGRRRRRCWCWRAVRVRAARPDPAPPARRGAGACRCASRATPARASRRCSNCAVRRGPAT